MSTFQYSVHPSRFESLLLSGRVFALSMLMISPCAMSAALPTSQALDAEVARAMSATQTRGLAVAVIDRGKVEMVRSYGARNAAGQPLQTDTIMYAASLTKVVFAWLVMQLVDEGRLDLDRPLARYLERPLPSYANEDKYAEWPDLAGDPRWAKITARHALNHATGFANFGFLEPDGKLRIHFDPGSRYGYSGDGIILLQFVIERGLGIDIGEALKQRLFDRLGMKDSSLIWRPAFAANLADGWRLDDSVEPHDERSTVRASGSMDSTITDIARFAAALVRGEGLSKRARADMVRRDLAITTASQFPTLQPELPKSDRRANLAAGLGVIVFEGPQGRGYTRGGHNDSTGNIMVCVERDQRCVVILGNDVRAEAAFPKLVAFVLGETGAPWSWLYGDLHFWSGSD